MRTLEARHHPTGRGDDFIVVGRVVCNDGYASVKPDPGLRKTGAPRTLLSNLRYLVAMNPERAFESLRSLDSRFWSFVEVETDLVRDARTASHSANDND